jgi:hypothetical protein
MPHDPRSALRIPSASPTSGRQPPDPPVRNLRDPEERPSAPDADRKAQGMRLALARQKYYKNASMAARALGIAGPTYLAHENGTRQIRDDIAVFYAEQFGVSPNWLLFNTGSGPELAAGDSLAAQPLVSSGAVGAPFGVWENAGLGALLDELNACRGPNNAFVPRDPGASEPGRLPPTSLTDGWIAELAPPAGGSSNDCTVAVSDSVSLVLRDILRIPPVVALERSRLFAIRLQSGVDLFAGQCVIVDPDETHIDDENMFIVTRPAGPLVPACIVRSPTGQVQIGRSGGRPPIDFSESGLQIVGRVFMQFKPLSNAEVREIADRMFGAAWDAASKRPVARRA